MLFNSWQFLLFFPIVACLYFSLPQRYRWMLLLVASYFFYMCWKPAYLVLIIISTLVDYFASLAMAKTNTSLKRKGYLIFSLCANLGLLFSFKYFNFFNESLRQLMGNFPISYDVPALNVLLPIGISFYTFQTLSYTIEVYRGNQEPERHLGVFALYVSYFPQLVAGPIERPGNLLPQFRTKFDFDYNRVTEGLRLMAWGMFKKVVIADRLALLVDNVYSAPEKFNGAALSIGTIFFAFQIYCDFSGYSDIAIGAAEVLGHRLMKNFDRPYFATSLPEFWKRWHISLSTWFRDYLYIPLGGNRVRVKRLYLNLMVVFLLSGLWHGANWTFAIWGALHGFYYLFGMITREFREKIAEAAGLTKQPGFHRILKGIVTFALVCFAWIFFRADSLSDALVVISRLGTGWSSVFSASGFESLLNSFDVAINDFWLSIGLICLLVVAQIVHGPMRITQVISRRPVFLRWAFYVLIVVLIMNLGIAENIPFIYFQF
ncbi:MAG: MBOAT family protein [Planctomycetes bacterium]|nr:MBOAT family protein [Planctomycetota bacterium]